MERRRAKSKRPAAVPVPTKNLLRDWEEKKALSREFQALRKRATKVIQRHPEVRNLKVPLRRVEKRVKTMMAFGIFGPILRRLGQRK